MAPLDLVILSQELQSLRNEVQILRGLLAESGVLMGSLRHLRDIQTIQMGAGDTAFHADQQGMWWGKETLAAIQTTPPAGTAILMNGDIYPKNGVSGTSTSGTGTVTVVRGIVTAIT